MEKIKIDELDRRTYYPMSFNEQMAWIDEEVEYLINDRDKTHKQLNEIRAMGKETYGTMKSRVTYEIHRLFEIIRSDPKNIVVLREVNKAEQELIAFLYAEPEALPEEICRYWNSYTRAYAAELERRISISPASSA